MDYEPAICTKYNPIIGDKLQTWYLDVKLPLLPQHTYRAEIKGQHVEDINRSWTHCVALCWYLSEVMSTMTT